MPLIDDPDNGGSDPGAWADALRHTVNITIISAGNPCFPTGATSPGASQSSASQAGSGASFQRQAHGENL